MPSGECAVAAARRSATDAEGYVDEAKLQLADNSVSELRSLTNEWQLQSLHDFATAESLIEPFAIPTLHYNRGLLLKVRCTAHLFLDRVLRHIVCVT